MTSSKLPYYQRYPRDYIADTMTLTLEEHGAYTLLLDYQWLHGAVPKNAETLGKLFKTSSRVARRLWAKLEPYFPAGGDHHHRNDRMERERQKAEQQHLTLSESGKKGTEVQRIRKAQGVGQADGQATATPRPGRGIPEADPDTDNNNYDTAAHAARPESNPLGLIMQAVRWQLYLPDGKPPAGWSEGRCASIAKRKLKAGTPASEILDAIEGFALLRDRGEFDWCLPRSKATLRVLYHTHSGAVPVYTLALNAIHERSPVLRGKSKPHPLGDLVDNIPVRWAEGP